ncbi:MAG: outer membrane protein assembly factor BamA [Bacteroidales bacterium]|nr:outer membrane protein assembly factor BamA [Bacteroidales bacterium]
MKYFRTFLFILSLIPVLANAQTGNGIIVDYSNPKTYIIGGVSVEGTNYLNPDQIVALTGMSAGQSITVPSDEVSSIVKRLWLQRYFSNVALYVDSLSASADTAFFKMKIVERPRVSAWDFSGIKNSEKDELKEKLSLRRGGELSDYIVTSSIGVIKDYFKEKGFLNTAVDVQQEQDTVINNAVRVNFAINKGPKIKIKEINYDGIEGINTFKLDRSMKKTKSAKWYNLLSSKKFNEKEYDNDKSTLIDAFNELGYRDAKIIQDSIYTMPDDSSKLGILFNIDQGKRYYFRNISWTGNSIYGAEDLNQVLKIKKGDIYDIVTLNERLYGGGKEGELTISTLFRNNGYLFFNVTPVETNIVEDSVDVEIRIVEGKQATFNNVVISGNNVTNENVIRRAVYTRPGYLYRQTDFERSIRELGTMTNFDAEKITQQGTGWNLSPNVLDNTVDISFNVEEKANSQLELSGGWGAGMFVGTVGINFSNFSTRNMFDLDAWKPVPLGDNQTLAFRYQTNGSYYTAISGSFMEPWLFGKKPTSLSLSAYFTRQTNSYISTYYQVLNNDQFMEVSGASVSLGSRLKWPDNYFVLYHTLSWQTYTLQDWNYYFIFSNGKSHNINYTLTLARNSTDQTIYPRTGSDISFGMQLTPPYSLMRKNVAKDFDYNSLSDADHYKWIEYNKWTLKASNFITLAGDFVLMTRAQFGYLGFYNRNWGYSPFEGFLVGGDGMSGYSTYGQDIISLRGYENYSLTPTEDGAYNGNLYDKFTVELRYPIMLQPQSTIYALLFAEGGNCWADINNFNPFQIKRSAGAGLRIFLPMIGLLGVDWGYGFDSSAERKGQFHFMIGQEF